MENCYIFEWFVFLFEIQDDINPFRMDIKYTIFFFNFRILKRLWHASWFSVLWKHWSRVHWKVMMLQPNENVWKVVENRKCQRSGLWCSSGSSMSGLHWKAVSHWNKVWWQCLVPTSTTRFASDAGYRMTKMQHSYIRKIFLLTMTSNSLTENEEHDIPSPILKTIFGLHASVIF